MGKYFEIHYSPEQFNAQTNSAQVIPWGGINTKAPPNLISPQFFTAADDVYLRNSSIRSRPTFTNTQSNGPDATIFIGLAPAPTGSKGALFVGFTTLGVYYSTNGIVWNLLGNNPLFLNARPVSWRIFAGKIYFTNGNAHLGSWDGSANNITVDNATVSGGATTVGAVYLDELDNHLIMANVNEGGTSFPQRLRWSASNTANVWDPTVNINAGLVDFLDVPDKITGLAMAGRTGVVARSNGFTEIAPTGQGIAPFDFTHLWSSKQGIGCVLPFGLGQYGTINAFVANDDIYVMTGSNYQSIGGSSVDSIFRDLEQAPNISSEPIIGFISPVLLGPAPIQHGISYLGYFLVIPNGSGSKVWFYSMTDNNWSRFNLPAGNLVQGIPCIVPGSSVTNFPPQLWWPMSGTYGTALGFFDATSFNDPNQPSSFSFRQEDIEPNRVPTVRRVVIEYIDISAAPVTITISVSATNDNGTTNTVSQSVTFGGSNDNQIKTVFVNLSITGFRPQLSVTRAAAAGELGIARMSMLGESEEVTL